MSLATARDAAFIINYYSAFLDALQHWNSRRELMALILVAKWLSLVGGMSTKEYGLPCLGFATRSGVFRRASGLT